MYPAPLIVNSKNSGICDQVRLMQGQLAEAEADFARSRLSG
jgi:hypothetical protein